ncbi:S-adenosyl-L-methionine-dependent methyltransferase [Suillus fuscotomentosus]|uniref:S-adenosyl-L-methionine-dependent methyltransferase n=1 Tax=Suillus fuscotomentosus TaxID=1912939 RepID=A0AAD4E0S9_9AGAM|nr:S-adenosyl-L-methionine-dependent methyltransferase [Suillus fuscotomentosus]KAG1897455.1 S-adenosyl-L-methionine-dependent methyltransferase [Suillus fuscotomentosus]
MRNHAYSQKMTEPNELKVEALLDIINSSARKAMAEYKNTQHGVPGIDAGTFHPLDLAIDTLALRKEIRLLEGACEQLNTILAPPQRTVHNFVNNYNWACIDVAVQSRIADVLDKHPEGLSVDVLADAVNLDKTKIARVLRVLALRGCFKEVKRDVFANTRLSLVLKETNNVAFYMKTQREFPKYATVLYETMVDQEFARSDKVERAPRVFTLGKEGKNNSFWEMNDEARDIFHKAMMGYSEIQGLSAVLHHYPWDNVSSVVDVGSGIGAMSIPLAKMFPHLRITNQDLPETIKLSRNVSPDIHSRQVIFIFDQTWETNAPEVLLDGRVEFVPLNFLEESPVVGKDVYYLRSIIHDWPDEESMVILHNVRKAMGPNSRVLIHECVLSRAFEGPDVGANESSEDHKAPEPTLLNFGSHTTYQMDMAMWLVLNGKERTLKEFKDIGASAGLVLTQTYDLVGMMLLEFRIAQD